MAAKIFIEGVELNVVDSFERPSMWTCEKYGVSMFAANAADFRARRFAAANRKGADASIGVSHCRTCDRGREEFELAGRRREVIAL